MALPAENEAVLTLPHPYLTTYTLARTERKSESGTPLLQVKIRADSTDNKDNSSKARRPLPEPLHNDALFLTEPVDLKSSERPPESNNTPWGRARRAPSSTFSWGGEAGAAPTLAQAWLLVYVVFTIRPQTEFFRLSLSGPGRDGLAAQLKAVLLAVDHPVAGGTVGDELLVLRSTFWQGAGSPFGPRPAWLPEDDNNNNNNNSTSKEGRDNAGGEAAVSALSKPLSQYPPAPLAHTMTADPASLAAAWHPRRPAKPRPGSVVYSRWIPHLGETFSMVALDWRSEEHLGLFHAWQNDPRVSQGWNETGTLDQHREYLRRADADPHQITILARFEDTFFAYFEVYWAKVCLVSFYLSSYLSILPTANG